MDYLDVISLAEAKLHLRVDSDLTEDNTPITRMIESALTYVENWTNILMIDRAKTYLMVDGCVTVYDYPINSVISPSANVFATATAQCTSCIATDTIIVNGLTYTAVAGTPADDTEFSIDTSDTLTAISLARAINGDTRTGTLGDVSATSATDTVTLTSNKKGYDGNATTLSQTGGTITVSTFSGGLDGNFLTSNIDKHTLYTNYSYGSDTIDLVLNVGHTEKADIPTDLIDAALEIIDLFYYAKETGKNINDLSPMTTYILNVNKRFLL